MAATPGAMSLPPITTPVPIYEGLLAAATASERETIVIAGPRQVLDDNLIFGGGSDHSRAIAAYAVIRIILTRIIAGTELCVTGIDPRGIPPRRESLDPSVVLHGRLLWEGRDGYLSKLLLHYLNPVIHITDLRIEPTERPTAPPQTVMARSTRLLPGERRDDTSRLRLMQEFIDQGMPPKTAAQKAVVAEPYLHATEASNVTRLVRKFQRLAKQSAMSSSDSTD